ncbi:hypothetical protein HMPREF0299_5696 [Corynebacterium matruchotii ATCC 14266]|uniref:Uncharacterized protein n=1 Tax=Corynebacterium matruchotii ATCC 14266 TaxID=553207 RepID=E0DDC3_9CORY|nr:hypothetical protein HMPREF0299_5696 [Corynebacterium matruchotii ATCC 14266]
MLFYGSPLVSKAFLLVAARVFGLCLVGVVCGVVCCVRTV